MCGLQISVHIIYDKTKIIFFVKEQTIYIFLFFLFMSYFFIFF